MIVMVASCIVFASAPTPGPCGLMITLLPDIATRPPSSKKGDPNPGIPVQFVATMIESTVPLGVLSGIVTVGGFRDSEHPGGEPGTVMMIGTFMGASQAGADGKADSRHVNASSRTRLCGPVMELHPM